MRWLSFCIHKASQTHVALVWTSPHLGRLRLVELWSSYLEVARWILGHKATLYFCVIWVVEFSMIDIPWGCKLEIGYIWPILPQSFFAKLKINLDKGDNKKLLFIQDCWRVEGASVEGGTNLNFKWRHLSSLYLASLSSSSLRETSTHTQILVVLQKRISFDFHFLSTFLWMGTERGAEMRILWVSFLFLWQSPKAKKHTFPQLSEQFASPLPRFKSSCFLACE